MSLKFGGKGKELFEDLFKNEQVEFPVKYNLKVILDATIPDHQNRDELVKALEELKVSHENWKDKLSKNGRYISFTIHVEIVSREQLYALYNRLKDIPGVKFAV